MILRDIPVLIVDAHETRLLHDSFVRMEGGTVYLAGSGAEAMSMLRHIRIGLVFCNLVLPGKMKGDTLCIKVRADDQIRRDVPFVLFTTQLHSDTDLTKMQSRIGANAIVPVPFRTENLRLILSAIIA